MDDISYMLRITVGVGRWLYSDLLDLIGPAFVDPGHAGTPITIHSLSADEAAAIFDVLSCDYGAKIKQEVQRGSYCG